MDMIESEKGMDQMEYGDEYDDEEMGEGSQKDQDQVQNDQDQKPDATPASDAEGANEACDEAYEKLDDTIKGAKMSKKEKVAFGDEINDWTNKFDNLVTKYDDAIDQHIPKKK